MTSPHIDTVEMQLVPDAGPRDFDQFRRIVVSPTVNPPEPFEGYAGYCGWPSVCRLHNGDLFVAFSQGYWHASWPTPLDAPSATLDRWKSVSDAKHAWILDWHAPQGGRIMWTRSRDRGLNWTAPKPFPQVHGAYYVACITRTTLSAMERSTYTDAAGEGLRGNRSIAEEFTHDPLPLAVGCAAIMV